MGILQADFFELLIEKVNANNLYKDRIRTWELAARMKLGSHGEQ